MPKITGYMSCWKIFELNSVRFCLQVCVRSLPGEPGSERDWSIPLHPAARHPGCPFGQPRQPVFLHGSRNHEELHLGWSTGRQRLSTRFAFVIQYRQEMKAPPNFLLFHLSAQQLGILSCLCVLAIWTGMSIYISLPHFLHGSPSLRENVLGLNPSEERHSTFLDVEPVRAREVSLVWRLIFRGGNSDAKFLCYFFLSDNWLHLEVCQEASSEYDVWTVKNHHVSCASPFFNGKVSVRQEDWDHSCVCVVDVKLAILA